MARLNLGLEGVIQLSRGYDGPEIDDFRDSGWDRERESPYRGSDRGRGHNWQTRANVRSKLQKAREVESRSDLPIAQSCERPESIRPTLSREDRQLAILKDCNRVEYTDRGRSYPLRPSEIHTLAEVGKFRVVGREDLEKFAYAGDRSRMESDLRNLQRQGLVEHRGTSALKKESRQVLTLTKQGQRLIRRHGFVPGDQAVYSGFVKPKEADHDADLYRLYHKAADEIERKGGKVLHVQLDYELKEKLYQRLARSQSRGDGETQRLKETFARDLHLPVVHGKVSFPDLRIEYATQEMEIARVDLELATRHYHAGHLAEKARAGLHGVRTTLSKLLQQAVEWNYLEENAARGLCIGDRVPKKELVFLEPRDALRLIESLPEPCRTVVLVAVLAGLRIGEIAALRWSRVDFFRGVIQVRETYSDETGFGTPKTRSSVREVPLSEPLRIALLAHRAHCSDTNGDAFVFASKANTPISPKNMAHRVLRPSCVRLGWRPIGWHVLRHTHATWLSESGATIRAAQDILGQSDMETTLRVYTHSVPDSKRRAVANVAALLFPSVPSQGAEQKERQGLVS